MFQEGKAEMFLMSQTFFLIIHSSPLLISLLHYLFLLKASLVSFEILKHFNGEYEDSDKVIWEKRDAMQISWQIFQIRH